LELLRERELIVRIALSLKSFCNTTIEFAYHIFQKLDLYNAEIIDAWYGLFKTGDSSYFATLEKLESQLS
jgi:hypothetical protein